MSAALVRTLVASAIALTLIVALAWFLAARDAEVIPRPTRSRAATPVVTGTSPALGGLPAGRACVVYLISGEAPERVQPLVEIRPGGALSVLRGPPPSEQPGPQPEPWLVAGIRLPGASVGALSARERATLLEVLRRWRPAGPSGGLVAHRVPRSEVDALRRWRRN